jgi:hypothetical protein
MKLKFEYNYIRRRCEFILLVLVYLMRFGAHCELYKLSIVVHYLLNDVQSSVFGAAMQ